MPNLDLDALARRVVLDALDELARDRIGLYEILGAKVDDLHEHPDGPVWVTQLASEIRAIRDRVKAVEGGAYVLNVARHDGYYLECGECDDRVTGIEPGHAVVALADLLAEARQHHEMYHQGDPYADGRDDCRELYADPDLGKDLDDEDDEDPPAWAG